MSDRTVKCILGALAENLEQMVNTEPEYHIPRRTLKWDEVNQRHYFVPKTVPKKDTDMTSKHMRYVIQLNTKEPFWYANAKYRQSELEGCPVSTDSSTQAKTYTKQSKAWRKIESLVEDGRIEFADATVKSVTITRTVQVNDV